MSHLFLLRQSFDEETCQSLSRRFLKITFAESKTKERKVRFDLNFNFMVKCHF